MIRYLPEAKEEFIEAARFYERREAGLGDRFLDELEACLDEVLVVVAVAHMTRKPGYWKARKRE